MENKKIFCTGTIILAVLMLSTVMAFGVSSPYWKGNPLTISPGETKIVKINYQNVGADAEDLTVRAEITKGSEIASLNKPDYLVKAGTKDTTVEVSVSIPAGVPAGSKYQVTLTSSSVTPGTEGGVSLGIGMDTTFDVEVVPIPLVVKEELAEEKSDVGILISVCLAIIIITIVLLIVVRKKRKGKH